MKKDMTEEINELRAANTRLRLMNERFVAVLDGVDTLIYVTDAGDHTILFVNQTAKKLFGDNLEGQKCYRALRQKDAPCFSCKIPQLLAAKAEVDRTVAWESFNQVIGRWFLNSERIIDWPGVPAALLTIGSDITQLKKAEEEKQQLASRLHQSQKMEAIGLLAGSIAHDLNNILSGVVSYPEFLLTRVAPDSSLRKPLETIHTSGTKAAKLVQGLLALSRQVVRIKEAVDLDRLVKEYLGGSECRELLLHHEKVRIAEQETEEELVVLGSPTHLTNVLANLVTNAAEAISEDGVITLSLAKVELAERPPNFRAWRPGPYARLTVSDTGSGIAKEFHEQIFEPIFSLNKAGRNGSGLGLAMVWGTVIDHQGYVEIASAEGQGARFQVYLPLVDYKESIPGIPSA